MEIKRIIQSECIPFALAFTWNNIDFMTRERRAHNWHIFVLEKYRENQTNPLKKCIEIVDTQWFIATRLRSNAEENGRSYTQN